MNILSILNPLNSIVNAAERAFERYQMAQTDSERIQAEKEMAFWQGRVEAANVAAVSDKWWSPRTIMGHCAAIYVFKIVVWDTVLGLGVTPNPGEQVTNIVMVIVGFYFVSRAADSVASSISNAIVNRSKK